MNAYSWALCLENSHHLAFCCLEACCVCFCKSYFSITCKFLSLQCGGGGGGAGEGWGVGV